MLSMIKLMKIIIIIVCVIQKLVVGNKDIAFGDGVDLFNDLMRDLFESCGTELGTIGYWANGENFQLPKEISDVVVMNGIEITNEIIVHQKIRFFVMIVDNSTDFYVMTSRNSEPILKIKTMFIFDKDLTWNTIDLFRNYQVIFENCQVYYCSMSDTDENTIDIITINSFTDYAPPFWFKIDDIYFDDNHGHWRFFLSQYSKENGFNLNGSNICDDIIFDRTKHLDGYAIKVMRRSQSDLDASGRVDELITKNTDHSYICDKLGISMGYVGWWLITTLNISLNIAYVSKNNREQLETMSNDVLIQNKSIDLILIPITWISGDKETKVFDIYYSSYPLEIIYDVIVTHNRGLMTPLEKMFNFYGWLTIIATTIIMLMVFVVVYLSNRTEHNSKVSFAIFECLRLLINNSIYTRMDTAKMRIFFFVIFLYFLIIQATFSGHLAAFLTKPEYRKNVETLDDLKDPRYTVIYASDSCKDYIRDPLLLNKTIFKRGDCRIDLNESVACIDDYNYLRDLVIKHKLHVPENVLSYHIVSLTMRNNWPLNDRVNNVVMWFQQSHLFDRVRQLLEELVYSELGVIRVKSTHDYYRPIEFEDVIFALILLAIGLFSALVSFVLEMFSETIKSAIKKLWKVMGLYVRIEIFQFRQLLEYLDRNFM